jgi:hypothetical protein
MIISIIANTFDLHNLSLSDEFFLALAFITINFYAILFAFINKNIGELVVNQKSGILEYQQYKDMFNCLQEGIIVIKEKK